MGRESSEDLGKLCSVWPGEKSARIFVSRDGKQITSFENMTVEDLSGCKVRILSLPLSMYRDGSRIKATIGRTKISIGEGYLPNGPATEVLSDYYDAILTIAQHGL